jgi:hypothetical protein
MLVGLTLDWGVLLEDQDDLSNGGEALVVGL